MRVNHINYPSENGYVYCRRLKAVTLLSNVYENHCKNCNMYAGSAQGEGVECSWVDLRKNIEEPYAVYDPEIEAIQIQSQDYFNEKLILKVEE